eukprot:TRINITY_DN1164_c0_g1_i4.p1 TRINITY_DN1164_c0_g1~~TRINITY_DN1164_c0_g1_i4.p1  ORF type:complete len:293 (-),score=-5.03 TRINITY_DN1164_c0_g1_i4:371-1249(-)
MLALLMQIILQQCKFFLIYIVMAIKQLVQGVCYIIFTKTSVLNQTNKSHLKQKHLQSYQILQLCCAILQLLSGTQNNNFLHQKTQLLFGDFDFPNNADAFIWKTILRKITFKNQNRITKFIFHKGTYISEAKGHNKFLKNVWTTKSLVVDNTTHSSHFIQKQRKYIQFYIKQNFCLQMNLWRQRAISNGKKQYYPTPKINQVAVQLKKPLKNIPFKQSMLSWYINKRWISTVGTTRRRPTTISTYDGQGRGQGLRIRQGQSTIVTTRGWATAPQTKQRRPQFYRFYIIYFLH